MDNEGARRSDPGLPHLFAYTLAPRLDLLGPAVTGAVATLPSTFVMNWNGVDSIGGSAGTQSPKEVRWVLCR